MMTTRRTFRPADRVSRDEDFRRAFAARCSAGNRRLVAYVAENGCDRARLGLSVGKRIGRAVTRVGVKRRLREAFRMSRERVPCGIDIVLVPKSNRLGTQQELIEDVVLLINRAAVRLRAADAKQNEASSQSGAPEAQS